MSEMIYNESGMRKLLIAILTRALEDLDRPAYEDEVMDFLESDRLDWVALNLGLSPRKVRERAAEVDPAHLKGFRRANHAVDGSLLETRAYEIASVQGEGDGSYHSQREVRL
jgi:hypothetical protein